MSGAQGVRLSVQQVGLGRAGEAEPVRERVHGRDRCWTNALDKIVNVFIINAYTRDVGQALEETVTSIYDGVAAFFWEEGCSSEIIYSRRLNKVLRKSQGMVGCALVGRSILNVARARLHPAYVAKDESEFCPPGASALLVPLQNSRSTVIGVLELVREKPFEDEFVQLMDLFAERFKLHCDHLTNTSAIEGLWGQVLPIMTIEQFLAVNMRKVAAFFECRCCEVWIKKGSVVMKYGEHKEAVEEANGGIVLSAMEASQNVNVMVNKYHSGYSVVGDGAVEEAVLVCVVQTKDSEVKSAIVLRGPKDRLLFVKNDEEKLKKVAPMVLVCLSNADEFRRIEENRESSEIAKNGLVEVAKVIAQKLDAPQLSQMVMEKARELTNADRASLFMLNQEKNRLVTLVHHGLKSGLDMPVTCGIVGKCVTEGVHLNVPDAYDVEFFDRDVDEKTGYRTKQVMCVPVRNTEGEIIGATEMLNKRDGNPFTAYDLEIIETFNLLFSGTLNPVAGCELPRVNDAL